MFRVRLKLKYRCSVQITRYSYYHSRGRVAAVAVVVISSGIGAVLFPCSRSLRDSLFAQVCVSDSRSVVDGEIPSWSRFLFGQSECVPMSKCQISLVFPDDHRQPSI